jgi:hypothetical protein
MAPPGNPTGVGNVTASSIRTIRTTGHPLSRGTDGHFTTLFIGRSFDCFNPNYLLKFFRWWSSMCLAPALAALARVLAIMVIGSMGVSQ